MDDTGTDLLTPRDLLELARRGRSAAAGCEQCAAIRCPGWESLPAGFEAESLARIGTLHDPRTDDPTIAEHHPSGTNLWSADAPIAPHFFPYNRCDVWRCAACSRPFLRYTEYGGYYQDARIRELDPDLIDTSRPD